MDDVTPERWLPVPGYEGLYEVSDQGNVRSLPRRTRASGSVTRGGNQWCERPGRILKPALVGGGYPRVGLSRDGVVQGSYIHQLVLLAFVGPCPPGQEVRHLDDVKTHNWLSNLAYGTRKQNREDARRNGIQRTRHKPLKAHCPSNHLYDEVNTRYEKDGSRKCRKCDNERHKQAYRDKKRQAA